MLLWAINPNGEQQGCTFSHTLPPSTCSPEMHSLCRSNKGFSSHVAAQTLPLAADCENLQQTPDSHIHMEICEYKRRGERVEHRSHLILTERTEHKTHSHGTYNHWIIISREQLPLTNKVNIQHLISRSTESYILLRYKWHKWWMSVSKCMS